MAENAKEPVDSDWDDEGVIPKELGPDTAFLFARMTQETLGGVASRAGDRVLDVGCGRGHDLASLTPNRADLFGFDGSRVMIRKSAETFRHKGLTPKLACGSAENLPFSDGAFHKVYCKGAIDHFYDPDRALLEMTRVLRPGGVLVVSVANFESLGCRLGRAYNRLHRAVKGRELPKPHFWEIPKDHVVRFHHTLLMDSLPPGVRLEHDRGISLFWGFPHWGEFLSALPDRVARCLLLIADGVARVTPGLADVILLRARKVHDAPIARGNRAVQGRGGTSATVGEANMKNYSRIQGLLLCLGTVVAAILFLIGVFMRSYWALAIPVAVGFLWLLGLGFWIGWTLLTIRVEPPRE